MNGQQLLGSGPAKSHVPHSESLHARVQDVLRKHMMTLKTARKTEKRHTKRAKHEDEKNEQSGQVQLQEYEARTRAEVDRVVSQHGQPVLPPKLSTEPFKPHPHRHASHASHASHANQANQANQANLSSQGFSYAVKACQGDGEAETWREALNAIPQGRISGVQFGLMAPDVILRCASTMIETPAIYFRRIPTENGINDLKMGTTSRSLLCRMPMCQWDPLSCPGHDGALELAKPVPNMEHAKTILKIKRSVCYNCSRLLLRPEHPKYEWVMSLPVTARLTQISKICKDLGRCGPKPPPRPKAATKAQLAKSKNVTGSGIGFSSSSSSRNGSALSPLGTSLCTTPCCSTACGTNPTASKSPRTNKAAHAKQMSLKSVTRAKKRTSAKSTPPKTAQTAPQPKREKGSSKAASKTKSIGRFEIDEELAALFPKQVTEEDEDAPMEEAEEALESEEDELEEEDKEEDEEEEEEKGDEEDEEEDVQDSGDEEESAAPIDDDTVMSPSSCRLTSKAAKEHPDAKKAKDEAEDESLGCGPQPEWKRKGLDFIASFTHLEPEQRPPSSLKFDSEKSYRILKYISDEDVIKLGFDPKLSHPAWMMFTVLPIPPPCIRPAREHNEGDGTRGQDDLTLKLKKIVAANQKLRQFRDEREKKRRAALTQTPPAAASQTPLFHNMSDPDLVHYSNRRLKLLMDDDQREEVLYNDLRYEIATYINNEIPGVKQSTERNGQATQGIRQKIPAKKGRIRGNCLGKRTNRCARSVISPECFMHITRCGVPEMVARILTRGEIVQDYNVHKLTAMVRRGPDAVGGANMIIKPDGTKIDLKFVNRGRLVLERGWVIERHMIDDDPLLLNRQPTLHRPSIMACKAKIMRNQRTIGVGMPLTGAYNADFDGDEMTLHVVGDEIVRGEVSTLMGVGSCILSARHGEPVIIPVQNAPNSLYQLTHSRTHMPFGEAIQLLYQACCWEGRMPLTETEAEAHEKKEEAEARAKSKPLHHNINAAECATCLAAVKRRTKTAEEDKKDAILIQQQQQQQQQQEQQEQQQGQQKHGHMIYEHDEQEREAVASEKKRRLEGAARLAKLKHLGELALQRQKGLKASTGAQHTEGAPEPFVTGRSVLSVLFPTTLDIRDENFCIHAGQLVRCGDEGDGLDRVAFRKIVRILAKDHGPRVAADFISGIQVLLNAFLLRVGCSLGIQDCLNPIPERTRALVTRTLEWVDKVDTNQNPRKEGVVLDVLEELRSQVGGHIYRALEKKLNKCPSFQHCLLQIVKSGAKGNKLNVIQILGLLGQQFMMSRRIESRLPQYTAEEARRGARIRGFVDTPYSAGLSPSAYFHHAMAGRENLVDIAVKVSATGYQERKMTKMMEDLQVQQDGSVRSFEGAIFQDLYGEDGCDASYIEWSPFRTLLLTNQQLCDSYSWKSDIRAAGDSLANMSELQAEFECIRKERDALRLLQLADLNELRPNLPGVVPFPRVFHRATSLLLRQNQKQKQEAIVEDEAKREAQLTPVQVVRTVRGFLERLLQRHLVSERMMAQEVSHFGALMHDWFSSRHVCSLGWTASTLDYALRLVEHHCIQGAIAAGEQVGTVAAQSIGEPATQMTLNTFHYAGQNSTSALGISRLKEITCGTEESRMQTSSMRLPIAPACLEGCTTPEQRLEVIESIAQSLPLVLLHDLVSGVAITENDSSQTTSSNDLPTLAGLFTQLSLESKEHSDATPTTSGTTRRASNGTTTSEEHNPVLHDTQGLSSFRVSFVLRKSKCVRYLLSPKKVVEIVQERGFREDLHEWTASPASAKRWVISLRVNEDTKDFTNEMRKYVKAGFPNIDMRFFYRNFATRLLRDLPVRGCANIKGAHVREIKSTVIDSKTGAVTSVVEHVIETRGANLREILQYPEIDARRVTSNDIQSMAQTFGIHTASAWIDDQLQEMIRFNDSAVNTRHTKLLSRVMCQTGQILPMNRFGVLKEKKSVFQRISFEEAAEKLFQAGAYAMTDPLLGVTENTMLGNRVSMGSCVSEVHLHTDAEPAARSTPSSSSTSSTSSPVTIHAASTVTELAMAMSKSKEKSHLQPTESTKISQHNRQVLACRRVCTRATSGSDGTSTFMYMSPPPQKPTIVQSTWADALEPNQAKCVLFPHTTVHPVGLIDAETSFVQKTDHAPLSEESTQQHLPPPCLSNSVSPVDPSFLRRQAYQPVSPLPRASRSVRQQPRAGTHYASSHQLRNEKRFSVGGVTRGRGDPSALQVCDFFALTAKGHCSVHPAAAFDPHSHAFQHNR